MEGIPQEVLIVGGVLLVGLAVLLIARYAKQILAFLLIAVGVVIVGLIAWGWTQIQKPDLIPDDTAETIGDVADIARVLKPEREPEPAPQPAPQPAQPVYSAPAPSGGGFCAGVLVALLVGAVGVGGYFYARWKLTERRERGGLHPGPGQRRRTQGQPLIYVIEGQADDLGDYGLIPWEEVDEWTESEFLQF